MLCTAKGILPEITMVANTVLATYDSHGQFVKMLKLL